jgi:hypothetical protein
MSDFLQKRYNRMLKKGWTHFTNSTYQDFINYCQTRGTKVNVTKVNTCFIIKPL